MRGFEPENIRARVAQIVTLSCVATGTLRKYGDVTLTDQLQAALSSRSVIDQAVGIMMASQHCTSEQAFAVIRGISQTRNIRVADIAQSLVDRTGTAET